jgi:hypothetical protein
LSRHENTPSHFRLGVLRFGEARCPLLSLFLDVRQQRDFARTLDRGRDAGLVLAAGPRLAGFADSALIVQVALEQRYVLVVNDILAKGYAEAAYFLFAPTSTATRAGAAAATASAATTTITIIRRTLPGQNRYLLSTARMLQ